MNLQRVKNITKEIAWFVGIFLLAVSVEYAFFELIDINPIVNVKIQGLIGLLFVGYGLRASYRIWKEFQNNSDPSNNGLPGTKLDTKN